MKRFGRFGAGGSQLLKGLLAYCLPAAYVRPFSAMPSLSNFQGLIVATLRSVDDGAGEFVGHGKSVPPVNRAPLQQMDPSDLREGSGPLHFRLQRATTGKKERVLALSDLSDEGFRQANGNGSALTVLDVYLYGSCEENGNKATHIELNRNPNEEASKTLKRVVLNLSKRLAGIRRIKGMDKKAHREVDLPTVWRLDPESNQVLDELDVSEFTDGQLWKEAIEAPLAVSLKLPDDTHDEAAAVKGELCLLVESCPPTVKSVFTFEDFTARLFPDVPVVVSVKTLFATRCKIDWYVGGQLKLADSACFTPDKADIDKEVAVLLTPVRDDHDGRGREEAYRFQHPVQPRPDNTVLKRRWQWLRDHQPQTDRIRAMTYNVLANQNAFQRGDSDAPFYPYTTKDVLAKERRLPLIVHEILSCNPDIICLQEVDEAIYESLFDPVLRHFGYQGYFACKSKDSIREGCAVFWSLKKFHEVPVEQQMTYAIRDLLLTENGDLAEFDDEEWKSMSVLASILEKRPDLLDVFHKHLGHIVQLVPLVLRESAAIGRSKEETIWVSNTHLFYHPLASHIRLMQMYLLARQLGSELQQRPGRVIVCGDFNSSLQNAAGKLLTDRAVPTNFRDTKLDLNRFWWENSEEGQYSEEKTEAAEPIVEHDDDFPAVSLPDSFPALKSAVTPTPPFTHYIDGFSGTLDHILISDGLLSVSSAPVLEEKDVTVDTAMPSASLPSDHVSLVCDLAVVNEE